MTRSLLILLALLALAPPAAAQDLAVDEAAVRACFDAAAVGETRPRCLGRASDRCQDAPGGATTPGIAACIAAETAVWDAILNEEYRATRAALAARDPALPDALRDAQRLWIAYRDAECALAHARWADGTVRGIVAANCLLVFTAERAAELRDMRGEGG